MLDIISAPIDVVGGDADVLHHVHFPEAMRFGQLGRATQSERGELDGFAGSFDFARLNGLLNQLGERTPVAVFVD